MLKIYKISIEEKDQPLKSRLDSHCTKEIIKFLRLSQHLRYSYVLNKFLKL